MEPAGAESDAARALERSLEALRAHSQWDPRTLPPCTTVHLGVRTRDGTWFRVTPSAVRPGSWHVRCGSRSKDFHEDSAALSKRAAAACGHGARGGILLKCVYTTRFASCVPTEVRCTFVGETIARLAGETPVCTVAVGLGDRRVLDVVLDGRHAIVVDRPTGRGLAAARRWDGGGVAKALQHAARSAGGPRGSIEHVICATATAI